ncbi:uncharacterized protein [Ptychodera flava]|uniref:uncharacterized protein n=1 Tax=Ptychodera flava TaxID=63121 RepID=UPI00396A9F55
MAGVLNDEVVLELIFRELDPRSLCQMEQVCHLWRDVAGSNRVWKEKVERLCRIRNMKPYLGRAEDWKTRYKQLTLGRLYPRVVPRAARPKTYEENLEALQPEPSSNFVELQVKKRTPIKEFIQSTTNRKYIIGNAYYMHTKSETIGLMKNILLRDKKTKQIYTGPAVRELLGLVRGRADWNIQPRSFDPRITDRFNIFVQSKSVGRMLVPRTQLLYKVS